MDSVGWVDKPSVVGWRSWVSFLKPSYKVTLVWRYT
jgi:hypothetical protein